MRKDAKSKKTIYKLCPICDKYFLVDFSHRKQIYCSKKCQITRLRSFPITKENHHSWKGGKPLCLDCGKELSQYTNKRCMKCEYLNRHGKNHFAWREKHGCIDCGKVFNSHRSIRCMKCNSKWRVGPNHHKWKGGVVKDINKLNAPEYKEWRKNVFKRDNFVCQMPGCSDPEIGFKKTGQLQAHHIKKRAEYPSLIHDIDNGITLCRGCHIHKVNGKEQHYEQQFIDIVSKKEFK